MRGQRGRLPVQPLGYVMSTKVIFRRAEVFVPAEVGLPRRPHPPTSVSCLREKQRCHVIRDEVSLRTSERRKKTGKQTSVRKTRLPLV